MQNHSSLKKYQFPLTCAVNFAYIIWLGSGVKEVLSNVSLKYHVPTAESPWFFQVLRVFPDSLLIFCFI